MGASGRWPCPKTYAPCANSPFVQGNQRRARHNRRLEHRYAPRMGFMQLPQPDGAATTVFYPSSGTEVPVRQGPFSLSWVPDGEPLRGNGRLVRPQEVSQAIDRVARHAALASQLSPDSAGVFGGSAGGHTALSLAGGQWSDELQGGAPCHRLALFGHHRSSLSRTSSSGIWCRNCSAACQQACLPGLDRMALT